ncbi:MAG: hypothetical protein KGQ39_07400 [Bacteroidetes bacterium]|nr:hypothetical protein [Bacteroidota bacterium]
MWVPFEQLPASARLWIFSSPVPLDTDLLLPPLQEFIRSWTAHQQDLRASASLSEGYFMLLAVDEAQTSASGCSIDKATHFVRDLGQSLNLNFLEKRRYFYRNGNEPIQCVDHQTMQAAVQNGRITLTTLVADTLVSKVGDLDRLWLPFGESWHRRLFGL